MGRSIEIPLNNSEEVLVVGVDDLLTTEEFPLINILRSEAVPLRLYLEFSREYFPQGCYKEFEDLLRAGVEVGLAAGPQSRDPDFLHVLTELALYYIEIASGGLKLKPEQRPQMSQTDLLDRATEYINRAEQINSRDLWTIIAKGIMMAGNLLLAKNQLDHALRQYKVASEMSPRNLNALLGMATVYSRKLDFKSALSFYQKALVADPNGKPDVRVAIGICYQNLAMFGHAQAAFERALEINPNNDEALCCLAIMEWNTARLESNTPLLASATKRINQAFLCNNRNPVTLLLLAERAFARRDHTKVRNNVYSLTNTLASQVEALAKTAIQCSDSGKLHSTAYELIARSFHAIRDFTEAHEYYLKAKELDPTSLTVLFGLGQTYIFAGENQKGIECLETVLARDPENIEVAQKLGSVCAMSSATYDQSLEHFKRVDTLTQKFQGTKTESTDFELASIPDPEVLIEAAKVYEGKDTKVALKALNRACDLYKTRQSVPPVELLNNIAVLTHREVSSAGEWENVGKLYDTAMDQAESGSARELSVTIRYNMARMYEQAGNGVKAEALYRQILDVHPSHLESIARIGMMRHNDGDYAAARAEFSKIADFDKRTQLILSGFSFLDDQSHKNNLRDARKSFEEVLQKFDKHDQVALTEIGNIYIILAKVDPKNREVHLKRALEFFDKSLRLDSRNVHSATGVGIVLAELGKFAQAQQVFTEVSQGTASLPILSINLAHVMVEAGNPRNAIPYYERVLKKSFESNVYVLQSLSRAYYIIAKTERDPTFMAVRIEPTKLALLYDIALVKQQYAQVLNDQPVDKRTRGQLEKAITGLDFSQKLFTFLGAKDGQSNLGYDIKQAKERASYCKEVLRISEKKIHETEVLERQREERIEAIKQEKLAKERQREEEQRIARENEQRKKEEVEKRRREIMQKVQEDNLRSREAEMEEMQREARKARDAMDVDKSDDEPGTEEKPKRKRSGGEKKAEKKRKKETTTDDEDEEITTGRVGKASNLSKAIIESDDEDY
ncbi:protein required for normal CLN1 and CLN2 G1 cyclin expression [Blyttiomyces sp. JEL0837]|nr:protein required for normal CLN1 and CLN2 G1 cyclin expression [Blyttiomyces sp. JEL0837]